MSQVNKYTDRAAYASDTDRLSTQSAVSLIASDNEIIYDGVNIVVGKDAASVGDCAVYDKTAGAIRFVKGETLSAAQLPATLTPLAVVYARQGDKVLIVSLDSPTISLWAYSYEVALSDFDLAAGGTIVLKFADSIEKTITYTAGATLSDLAAAANAAFKTGEVNMSSVDRGGWSATADEAAGRIVLTSNGYSKSWTTIEAMSGATLTTRPDDTNYQAALTGLLLDEGQTVEYVRRKNGVNGARAGMNSELFLQYYSANGTAPTSNVPLGSETIVNQASFEGSQFCAELRAAYADYASYLFGEHMAQYPSAYGAMLRDGRTNTAKIGRLRFTDIYGQSKPCYPAAAAALEYGVAVESTTTGLEAGSWWLPSVEELYLLLHDRVLTAGDVERDPVNRTLSRLGKATLLANSASCWTSCEGDIGSAFMSYRIEGVMFSYVKCISQYVRPVAAL